MKYDANLKNVEIDLFFDNVVDVEGDKPANQKPSWEVNLVANLLMSNDKIARKFFFVC